MPEKILYLLGAGASANALPLAKTIVIEEGKKLIGLRDAMRALKEKYALERSQRYYPEFQQFLQDVDTILKQSKEFDTIDTYAKYLWLQNRQVEYRILKKVLSTFFTIAISHEDARDLRYKNFLVSIMSERRIAPNINFLNWNYDSLFQQASLEFLEHESKNQHPILRSIPPSSDSQLKDCGTILHLNGMAGSYANDNNHLGELFYVKKPQGGVGDLIKAIYDAEEKYQSQLSFAWEGSTTKGGIELSEIIMELTYQVTILVVIGYSFPFFNREIDKNLFAILIGGEHSEMPRYNPDAPYFKSKLNKIYYQSPNSDGQQLYSQFGVPERIPIVHVKQTESFHIPYEL